MPKTFRSKEDRILELEKKRDAHLKNVDNINAKIKALQEAKPRGKAPSPEKLFMETLKAKGITLEEVMTKLNLQN